MAGGAQSGVLAHHRRVTPLMYAGIYAPLVVLGISIIYPFYYYLINSVNTLLHAGPAYLLPPDLTLRNYQVIFANNRLLTAFTTSTARTVVGTVFTVFNCAMCAFALRKPNLPFRNWYLVIFAIPLFFSGGLIPIYLNLRFLGLLDTFWVYIFPQLFSFFYVIIMMTSFNDLPVSLEDSARIDGAGYFRIFVRIYFPISMPLIAAIALFAGVAQWNSWFDTLYFTRSESLETLQAVLLRVVKQSSLGSFVQEMAALQDEQIMNHLNPEGVQFATMLVTVLPIVMVYPFLQRYFIKGILIGSIKG